MGRLRMRLFLSIIFIGECFAQWVDNPSCNFYGPNGYTLSWSADPSGIIYFNYTQNNFPTNGNYWTGVTFGTASDSRGDAIIFETQNGQLTVSSGIAEASSTCNTCPQQGSVLQKSATNIISTSYASISSDNVRAEFSRPLFNNGITLASCNFWIFYTQPTPVIENANSFTTSATPIPQQICDIVNSCPLNAIYGSLSTSMPSTIEHTTQYPSTYSTTTPFYQPLYDEPFASPATVHSDYSNSATYASNINYAPNSNYQFLNASLQQQYLGNNGIYSAPLYDESNQENPPILTNAEQNQVNYQKILRDYQANPNPTANMTFTNNIYGYNYNTGSASSPYSSSSTGSSYSSDSNSPLYTGTSYSSSPYNSVYSNPTYSTGIASASSSSSSSVSRPQYYYYSSVYPSYLVPGPYYYRVRDIGSYYSSSSTGSSSTSSSSSSTQAQLSTDSSYNTLGFNPLTGVYSDTPSSNGMSSSSSTSQAYYQPSASVSDSFTPYFYSPFVQSYGNLQYDTSSPTGTAAVRTAFLTRCSSRTQQVTIRLHLAINKSTSS